MRYAINKGKKETMPRPTKLTDKLVEKAQGYLRECEMGGEYFGDLPTIPGLAIHIDVARQSIYNWKDEDSDLGREFLDIVERILTKQEYMLTIKSLKGDYNASIAKLILSSKHGIVEKTATDITTDNKPLQGVASTDPLLASALLDLVKTRTAATSGTTATSPSK